jgi:hypothetical protein
METLLIIQHSLTGGTLQMARAAAHGAATEPTVITRLLSATAAQPSDLLAADGYIFATPEKLAATSGLMKDFSDRTYYPVFGQIEGDRTLALSAGSVAKAPAVRSRVSPLVGAKTSNHHYPMLKVQLSTTVAFLSKF